MPDIDAWVPAGLPHSHGTTKIWNPDAGSSGGATNPVVWGDLLVPYTPV